MRVNQLSVVVPTFNGAQWLRTTISIIDEQLSNASLKKREILVVDDGSTDDTIKVLGAISTKAPLRVVSQENGGRFRARETGAIEAKYDYLLYIDTRIELDRGSLDHILSSVDSEDAHRVVWCSHVNMNKDGNMYARFWDAIARVVWRRYFKNPRPVSYGVKDFDYYPKGTTCFFVPRKIIIRANQWFVENSRDIKKSNDDTLLLRRIIEDNNLNLDPKFSCTYNARSSFKQFLKHSYHRGNVFVDGFFRRDGNMYLPIALLITTCILLAPLALIVYPTALLPGLLILAGIWVLEFVLAVGAGVGMRDALSLFVLTPAFTLYYVAGIVVAFTRQFILRKA